uniref:hypothetical protein n=1 Tax=Ndongobacter massiliensis TaxID=1871025 RepID=UPI000930FD57|nr:hypothetical protein [Ndongobacter massiliensis]
MKDEKKAPSLTSLLTSWTTPTSGKVGLAKLSDEKKIGQNQERTLIKMEGGLPDQIWRGRSKREKGRVIQVETIVDTKDVNLEILHFKQFCKHFVFEKDEEGFVKKAQKNYLDVRVVFRLV